MADPTKPDSRKPHLAGNYTVGYKKPPKEHQFKPEHLRDEAQRARTQRTEKGIDVAAWIDKPVKVKRRGKSTNMHPHEASLISLWNRALKGESRATKLFLKECEVAGLLEPAPVGQTHGVFVIPRGANRGIMKVLLETYGLPPWDPDIYASLEAEYERDQARIEELYNQFLEDLENE